MEIWMVLALVAAGFGAGFINAVVGSGTLLTFPTLLFVLPLTSFGVPAPLVARTANVTNSVGLVPGGISAILGYREEVREVLPRLKLLLPATALGAIGGALLLVVLPGRAFNMVVPILIALSLLLVVFGRRIQAWAARHHGEGETPAKTWLCAAGMVVSGAYGAYFGAAQGVLMVGIMNILIDESLQHINALKNVLGLVNNGLAVVVFLLVDRTSILWPVAGALAVGTLAGAYMGARLGRRLSPAALRAVIVVIGTIALIKMIPDALAAFAG